MSQGGQPGPSGEGSNLLVDRMLKWIGAGPEDLAKEESTSLSLGGKVRDVVRMMQSHIRRAEDRAELAEAEKNTQLAIAEEQKARLRSDVKRLQSALNAMTRYAEDLEGERDEARDEAARLARARPSGDVLPPPAEMSLEELKAECKRRGISEQGALALLRTRVRAARLQVKAVDASAETAAPTPSETRAARRVD